jgi:hypothetical protein
MLFTKWLFIAKVRSIRMHSEASLKAEAAKNIEK